MKVWFECHGIHHSQYWQGAGGYDGPLAIGIGPTQRESADDALDMLCQQVDIPPGALIEADRFIQTLDDEASVCEECDDKSCYECELAYYTVAYLK